MARACFLVIALGILAAACARPDHAPAPLPPPPPGAARESRGPRPEVKAAILEAPSGGGNWGRTLEISPAPATLVVSCLPSGAAGWISVSVVTNDKASKTSVVEASPDVAIETRECIANALQGLHSELGSVSALVYITFSPE